jgi:hypothetical protein
MMDLSALDSADRLLVNALFDHCSVGLSCQPPEINSRSATPLTAPYTISTNRSTRTETRHEHHADNTARRDHHRTDGFR